MGVGVEGEGVETGRDGVGVTVGERDAGVKGEDRGAGVATVAVAVGGEMGEGVVPAGLHAASSTARPNDTLKGQRNTRFILFLLSLLAEFGLFRGLGFYGITPAAGLHDARPAFFQRKGYEGRQKIGCSEFRGGDGHREFVNGAGNKKKPRKRPGVPWLDFFVGYRP